MRGEAGEHRDVGAVMRLELDHRAVFAGQMVAAAAQFRRGHAQGSKQHAQRVEMMDQHLGDQHSLLPAHEGLPFQRRTKPIRSRQHARCQQRQLRLLDVADAPGAQPGRGVAIVAAEAPVLVHHQAGEILDLGGERGRLREVGRERLLAEHRQSPLARQAGPAARASRAARRYRRHRVRSPPAWLRRRETSAECRTRRRVARRCHGRDRRPRRPLPDPVSRPRRSDDGGCTMPAPIRPTRNGSFIGSVLRAGLRSSPKITMRSVYCQ